MYTFCSKKWNLKLTSQPHVYMNCILKTIATLQINFAWPYHIIVQYMYVIIMIMLMYGMCYGLSLSLCQCLSGYVVNWLILQACVYPNA